MVKKFLLAAFLLIYSISLHAIELSEIIRPSLIPPQTPFFDESCYKNKDCYIAAENAKNQLANIYYAFNVMHYRKDISPLNYVSWKFKTSINQNSKNFRIQAIGDAEQVISFAIQNISYLKADRKLQLKIYTIVFTEGMLFLYEAHTTFTAINAKDQWYLDSYDVIKSKAMAAKFSPATDWCETVVP